MVEESKKHVPGTVVVLGALWLVAAAGSLVWAAGLLFVFGVISNFTPGGMDGFPPPPPIAKPIYWAFQHYVVVGLVQSLLSLFGIYSGVKFLRLTPWARGVLETAGWLAIGLSLVLGLWLSEFWLALASDGSKGIGDILLRLFFGLFSAAFYAVIPIVFVWLLRSRSVREAFVPTDQQSRGAA